MQPCSSEESVITEEYYFHEFPVVLSPSRLHQPLSDAPNAVTVITNEIIKASGFRSVPDLMRLVPGMYVGYADANNPVVSLNGSMDGFSRRMQVLIDGRSIYLPPFSGVNWANLPLMIEDIERIEVVRGPSSASYGTNSFFGVINIITRDAENQSGGSVSVTRGNASDASARIGKSGEQFDFHFSVGRRSDQGLNNATLNDQNATNLFNVRSNYRISNTDSLDVQLGGSNGTYGAGIAGFPDSAFRDTTAQSNFQQIGWSHLWHASDETKLTYYRINSSSLDPYLCINIPTCRGASLPAIPIAQGFVQQSVSSQRDELELQNTFHTAANNRLVWGASARRDYANYPLLLGKSYTLNSWQAFAHDEWHITNSTVLNIGTMLEDDGVGSKNKTPRFSLNYHITQQHTVRAGVSTATRSPGMGEEFMQANNTILGGAYVPPVAPLRPEKVLSKEVGYLGDFHSLGLNVDTRVYVERVSNMIALDKYVNGVGDSFKNLLAAEYKGFEATVKYSWDEGHSFLSSNYTYQRTSGSLRRL